MDIARLKLARQGLGIVPKVVAVEKVEVSHEALTAINETTTDFVEPPVLKDGEHKDPESSNWTAVEEPQEVQPSAAMEMDSISMQLLESSATEGEAPEDVANLDEPILPSSTAKPSPLPGLLVSAAGAGIMATAALLGGKR